MRSMQDMGRQISSTVGSGLAPASYVRHAPGLAWASLISATTYPDYVEADTVGQRPECRVRKSGYVWFLGIFC